MITVQNVTISGVSACVPPDKFDNLSLSNRYGEKKTKQLIDSLGVNFRQIADDKITAGDLCYKAAKDLIKELSIEASTIGALIFISQTPDYQTPATAPILQNRLGLSVHTIAYDVNLGCSGYVYGLFLASTLIQSGIKRVLILVGDTLSKLIKDGDRSTDLLFGDAGSACIIEEKPGAQLSFELGTDGSGSEHIIARLPKPQNDPVRGVSSAYVEMNGLEVFSFTLERIPSLVNRMLEDLKLTSEEMDLCVYHQANKFIIQNLAERSHFSMDKVPLSIHDYGNTSGASIPVTLCSQSMDKRSKTLMVGFGVGLSWGAVFADLSQTLLLPLSIYKVEKVTDE